MVQVILSSSLAVFFGLRHREHGTRSWMNFGLNFMRGAKTKESRSHLHSALTDKRYGVRPDKLKIAQGRELHQGLCWHF